MQDISGEKHYRIAFFTVDWNYELVENTLQGLKDYVDDHPDVHVCVFDCFGKDIGNARDQSEYAIYQLPDLSAFDGALVLGNQIVLRSARQKLSESILRSGIPAITIGCPMEGCQLISFDNQEAQHDIADHVIREHGARQLVYLTGILDNECPEAEQRLDGFLAACRENGIPEENIQVFQCTWRTADGTNLARRWISEHRTLPDAFICANDEMAMGMVEEFREHGVLVPRDTIITGFDNLSSAEMSSPRISTINCNYRRLHYDAMDQLMTLIRDGTVQPLPSRLYDMICSESCGCPSKTRPGQIQERYFSQTRFLKNFYLQQDDMAGELFAAEDLKSLMNAIEKSHTILGCENLYLCINDYYFDNYDKNQWEQDSESFSSNMVLAACGVYGRQEQEDVYIRFPTRSLLPDYLIQGERFLIFYPLHYNTYSMGYIALNGISVAARMNLHESIFTFLEIAIENVRKKELLRHFNDVLDNLYVHDALTGLFNRFGLSRFGQEYFRRFRAAGGARILFTDMDDMKNINDLYGHEYGDAALKATAHILRECFGEEAFIMRYGGDEFVAILPWQAENAEEQVQSAVHAYNEASGMPFRLGLSLGTVSVDARENKPLSECIKQADNLMYEAKAARR